MKQKSRMYEDTVTWNPFKGCGFNCTYCEPSFKRQAKRAKCDLCKIYIPHFHRDRLKKFPSAKTLFVCGNGDISYAIPPVMEEILVAVAGRVVKRPKTTFYWQSKNPAFFADYLDWFINPNYVLLTTLETNRDEGYHDISHAPLPSDRWVAFKDLDWPRKILTVEPILEFDLGPFLEMILKVNPEMVYL